MSIWSIFGRRPTTAAEWFAVRRERSDPKLDRQFQEWLAADPSHGEDYALCEITWEVSGDAARHVALPEHRLRQFKLPRRSVTALLMAAAVAGIAIWVWPPAAQTFATAPGEQRTVALEDGTRITLNTRSRVVIRFDRRQRDVILEEGEVFFAVAKDPSRPFVVHTTLGTARALGTRFNLYLENRRLAVTTEEGQVLMESKVAGNGVVVAAGRRGELLAGSQRANVEPANVPVALNWISQRLDVDNAQLETVLRDFSRYTVLPVRAATPEIAAMRVSAVLRTGDIDALEATLRGAFGLKLERRETEYVVVAVASAAAT